MKSLGGFKKAFVVYDKDLLKFGTAQMVLDELKDTPYELFTDFKANPTVTNVIDGVKAFKEAKADLVIAMGVDTAGMSIDEAAHAAVEAVRKLSLDLGVPKP